MHSDGDMMTSTLMFGPALREKGFVAVSCCSRSRGCKDFEVNEFERSEESTAPLQYGSRMIFKEVIRNSNTFIYSFNI